MHHLLTLSSPCRSEPSPMQKVLQVALSVAVHRVEYVVRTRNLKPAARAGNLRVFSETDVAYVASELRRMDADRSGSLL